MLEAFFLQISDEQYYQHTDFTEQVGDLLFANDDKTLLYIAGPGKIGTAQDALPIYIVAKEHSELNAIFSLDSHGYIAVTSRETGEIKVFRVSTETKEPQYSDAEAEAELLKEAGPGYEPKATTTYHYRYRDLEMDEVSIHDGDWYVLAGNGANLSNQLMVHATRCQDSESALEIVDSGQDAMANLVEFYPLDQATPVPEGRFHFASSGEDEFSHVLNYSLPDDKNPANDSIPVHLLFSASEFESPLIVTLMVPKEVSHLASDVRLGAVRLNLSSLMAANLPAEAALPASVNLVVISRGVYLLIKTLAL